MIRLLNNNLYVNMYNLFNCLPDSILAIDTEQKIVIANDSFSCMSKLSKRDLIGCHVLRMDKECSGLCMEKLLYTLKHGINITDYRINCSNPVNPHQEVVITTVLLHDDDGKTYGALLVIKDITELAALESELKTKKRFGKLIGRSPEMNDLYSLIEKIALVDSSILILGESGTGKELVVDAVHSAGNRSDNRIVKINCSAIPDNLLESEIFGYKKGAFTGAQSDKFGLIQEAEGGTLFLDEIAETSLSVQAKLLRFLDSGEYQRLGDTKTYKADVRLLAATNRNLPQLVREGRFREDFYYRLNVMELNIPPLRSRKSDIPLLVEHFIKYFSGAMRKDVRKVSDKALSALMAYDWPGNVRELRNALEHGCILCTDTIIDVQHLPHFSAPDSLQAPPSQLRFHGRPTHDDILQALEQTGWNKTKAAALLGINRKTIHRRLKHLKAG